MKLQLLFLLLSTFVFFSTQQTTQPNKAINGMKTDVPYTTQPQNNQNERLQTQLPVTTSPSEFFSCPKGARLPDCEFDPCQVPAPLFCNYSVCVKSPCGGCSRKFFDANGVETCTACTDDSSCKTGEFCHLSNCSSTVGACIKPPKECPSLYRPVCSCDGKNFPNSCTAVASLKNINFDGPCFGICTSDSDCRQDEFCKVDSCGSLNGTCTKKTVACTRDYRPVCGCDGKTYSNPCVADSVGISVRYNGACGSTCPSDVPLVRCEIDPCMDAAPAGCHFVKCVPDYCGGCFKHYYDETGREVCNPSCEKAIDDFSISPTTTANQSFVIRQNLLTLDTGSDGTMQETHDAVKEELHLTVLSDRSYWYSFFAGRSCFDASGYAGIRFRVAGEIQDDRFQIGLLIGAKVGPEGRCQRVDTKYIQWREGIRTLEDPTGNIITFDFPFEIFGITEEEKSRLVAIELSNFAPSTVGMTLILNHLDLVTKDCLFPQPECFFTKINDFLSTQLTNTNLLSHDSGSEGTMKEELGAHSLLLTPLSLDSHWITNLASPDICFDGSHHDAIRITFTEIFPIQDFRIGLQVGQGSPCTLVTTHYVPFFHGTFRKGMDQTVVDFPFSLFGISSAEIKNLKGIELSGFKISHLSQRMGLVDINLISKSCLPAADCTLQIEDFSRRFFNILGLPSGSFGTIGEEKEVEMGNGVILTIKDQSSRWVTTLSRPGSCFNTSDFEAIRFQLGGVIRNEDFRVGVTPADCNSDVIGPFDATHYVSWKEGVKGDAIPMVVDFPLSAFGITKDVPKRLYSIELSGFLPSTFGNKLVLRGVGLVRKCPVEESTIPPQNEQQSGRTVLPTGGVSGGNVAPTRGQDVLPQTMQPKTGQPKDIIG